MDNFWCCKESIAFATILFFRGIVVASANKQFEGSMLF
jgi:hypothetical protein